MLKATKNPIVVIMQTIINKITFIIFMKTKFQKLVKQKTYCPFVINLNHLIFVYIKIVIC